MATPEEMLASMLANLPEKTGKPLDEWKKIVDASGLEKHGQIMKLLKGDHGVTHGFANVITMHALGKLQLPGQESANGGQEDLVAAQYAGAKAALKPIYDALLQAIQKFGQDVEIAPKKAYVSLRRKKQFGLIQPSTKTRVDVGINLKGTPLEKSPTDRLEASGSFNAMVSHRVRVTAPGEIDGDLVQWLKAAYEAAG
jgi:hypothetical protein